jgi:hypothetical protein
MLLMSILFPNFSYAQSPLVPCGLSSNLSDQCQFCHLTELIQNVIRFIILYLAAPVATLLFAWAGMNLMIHADSEGERGKAKQLLKDIIIGFLWILFAWTVVNIILSTLVDKSQIASGSWFKIQCSQDYKTPNMDFTSYQGNGITILGDVNASDGANIIERASQGTQTIPEKGIDQRIANTDKYRDDIEARVRQRLEGKVSEEEIKKVTNYVQGIMAIESNGAVNAVSPVGALGLMQLMPDTAKNLDPSLKGKSTDEIRQILTTDAKTNINLGTDYYLQMYDAFGKNPDLAAAAYNGGPAANGPSRDCPGGGVKRWECPYDEVGCYNTGKNDCKVNKGFQETRNYVGNHQAVVKKIGS